MPSWLLINYRDQETITVDEEVKVRIPEYDNISSYITKKVKLDLPKGIKSLLLKKGSPLKWHILHDDGKFRDTNKNFYVNGVNIGSTHVQEDVWISQNDEFGVGFALYPNNNYAGPECVFQLGYEYDIDEAILYNEETARFNLLTSEEEPHTILYQDKNCPIHFELIPTSIKTSGTILRTNTTIENEVRGLQDKLNGTLDWLHTYELQLHSHIDEDCTRINYFDYRTSINIPSGTSFDIGDRETTYIRTYKYAEGDYDIDFGSPVWYSDPQITMHINPHNYSETYMEINGAKVATQNDIDVLNAKFEQLPVLEKEVDSTKAVVNVPNDALDYCLIDEIGGMSYDSENLICLNDDSYSSDGVTWTVKNNKITVTGTNNKDDTKYLNFACTRAAHLDGVYSNNWFVNKKSGSFYALYYAGVNSFFWTKDGESLTNKATINGDKITRVCLSIKSGESIDIEITPMLVKGSVIPTKYKSGYTGFKHSPVQSLISEGNILNIPDQSGSANGMSWVVKDGVITLNGASTGVDKSFNLFTVTLPDLPDGKYSVFVQGMTEDKNNYMNASFNSKDYKGFWQTNYNNHLHGGTMDFAPKYFNVGMGANSVYNNHKLYISLVKGDVVPKTFKPYTPAITLPIPEAAQALDGYGLGVNKDYYNYIWYNEDAGKYYYAINVASYTFTGEEIIYENIATNDKKVYQCTSPISSYIYKEEDGSRIGDIKFEGLDTVSVNDTWNNKTGVGTKNNSILWYIPSIQTVEDMRKFLTGKTIVYRMNNPTTMIIDTILPEELYLEVQNQGTITFNNDYNLDMPNKITYAIKAF